MSVLQSIETALQNIGFEVESGKYPDTSDYCGKILFTGKDKPVSFLGGADTGVETFKVVVRGGSYNILEQKANAVSIALKNAGFVQTGGYEDIESKEGEMFLQIAVNFKKYI